MSCKLRLFLLVIGIEGPAPEVNMLGFGTSSIGLPGNLRSTPVVAAAGAVGVWLGGRDSNPDKQSQSLLSYR